MFQGVFGTQPFFQSYPPGSAWNREEKWPLLAERPGRFVHGRSSNNPWIWENQDITYLQCTNEWISISMDYQTVEQIPKSNGLSFIYHLFIMVYWKRIKWNNIQGWDLSASSVFVLNLEGVAGTSSTFCCLRGCLLRMFFFPSRKTW